MNPSLHALLWQDIEIDNLLGKHAEIAAILKFESALAQAQMKHGLVTPEAANSIVSLCTHFVPDLAQLSSGVMRDGMIVPDLIRQLRAALAEQHRGSLHLRSTSQDVIDTALVLRLRDVMAILKSRIDNVIAHIDSLERRFGNVQQMARTRMQRALPIETGQRLDAWRAPFGRHCDRLVELKRRLLVVQCGGPIGSDPSPWLSDLAELLDLGSPQRSWHTARDSFAELASWLSMLTGTAGKIGIDIALMSQNEVGEATIEGGGKSSAMHHKSNPVTAEILVAISRFNASQLGCFHQALVHEQERSGTAWALEWMCLPGMLSASGASLNHLDRLLANLTLHPDRLGT